MDTTKYAAIKSAIKTGDCLLWSGKGIIPGLIQDITESPYSHAGLTIVFEEYPNRVYTIEALGKGVAMSELEGRLAAEDGGCTLFPLKPGMEARRRDIAQKALALLGMPYDYRALIELAFERARMKPGETICSELVQRCYGIEGDILTPADVSKLDIFEAPIKL